MCQRQDRAVSFHDKDRGYLTKPSDWSNRHEVSAILEHLLKKHSVHMHRKSHLAAKPHCLQHRGDKLDVIGPRVGHGGCSASMQREWMHLNAARPFLRREPDNKFKV